MKTKRKNIIYNFLIAILNVIFIFGAIISAILYSKNVREIQQKNKLNDFITNVESMKQISQNYFDSESGYVSNWANYISSKNMDLDQALDFLKKVNTNSKRFAHIVDMDTLEAYSSYYEKGQEQIDTYVKFSSSNATEYEKDFLKKMKSIFDGTSPNLCILGKYQINEMLAPGVSVGKKVTISNKDYLLLRIIPAYAIKSSWIFPVDYVSAEVGIITNSGDYVIQSSSMKSESFLEYIRGYNFQNDYNKVNDLEKKLKESSTGILEYKNFRGIDCIYYYSLFSEDSDLDIIGCIYKDELTKTSNDWILSAIISGTILVLAMVNSLYLFRINKKLKETAILANQASQSKTYFLSAMSHDIRTPLNAILGMIYIAKENIDDSKYAKECLEKSESAGKQLLTLVNDILDISKIESGKLTLNNSNASLLETFKELKEIITPQIMQKNIEFVYDVDNLKYEYVQIDKARLEQICLNLLSNAVKYTNANGKIEFIVNENIITNTQVELVISIEDNGIGMSEDFQKKMYQSFSRAIDTQVNNIQGTGLGLYIVKLIVEAMGGTISCNSKLNVGTKFIVKLPLKVADSPQKLVVEENINYDLIQQMHLLVAEDNKLNREIIQAILNNNGITCDLVENGSQCIEKLTSMPFGTYDLILMDVHMPIMDGIEATKRIRNLDNDLKNIPIIAMTADAFKESIQACLDCGMNMHIDKPINVEKLFNALTRIQTNKKGSN